MHFYFDFRGDVGYSGVKDYTWRIYRNQNGTYEDNLKSTGNSATGTNVADHKRWEWSSGEDTSEGKVKALMTLYDNAGNSTNCWTSEYYLDRTAPSLSYVSGGLSGYNTGSGCGSSDGECIITYSGGAGVKLKSQNNNGVSQRSGFDKWGAIAMYQYDATCEHWGENDYVWNFTRNEVCSVVGTGKIKRCYKVRDEAGNISDAVCTCQTSSGITNHPWPGTNGIGAKCFSGLSQSSK